MKRIVFAGACALASVFALGPAAADPAKPFDRFAGLPLTTVTYHLDTPLIATPLNAITGLAGGIAEYETGKEMLKVDQIENPADGMMAKLAPMIADAIRPSATTVITGKDSDNDGAKDLAAMGNGQGAVLGIETRAFMIIYFPFDWSHYKVKYSARARLVEGASAKKIADSNCDYASDDYDDTNRPRLGDLLKEKGALLKVKLAQAVDVCVAQFQKDFHLASLPASAIAAAPAQPATATPSPYAPAQPTGSVATTAAPLPVAPATPTAASTPDRSPVTEHNGESAAKP